MRAPSMRIGWPMIVDGEIGALECVQALSPAAPARKANATAVARCRPIYSIIQSRG